MTDENIIDNQFIIDESLSLISSKDINYSYYGDYSSYIDNKYNTITGETSLWRAVLLQAFLDLKSKSKKKRNQGYIKEAKDWFILEQNQQDIKEVCARAGYCYKDVKKLANEIIEKNKAR